MEYILQFLYYAILPLGIFFAIYLYSTRKYGYWKRMRVPEVPPMFPLGSVGLDLNTTQGKSEQKWYKKYGKLFGIYEGSNPVLVVADPELLKDILVKDFNTFSHQREIRFGDPILDKMLFSLNGEPWKDLRSMMTPTFSSGKMRMMTQYINECGNTLIENFIEAAKQNKEIDVGKYFDTYTMDVIARCAFGIKLESRKDPDNLFVTTARLAVAPVAWRFIILAVFPGFAEFIRLSFFDPKVSLFFKDVTLKVIKSRSEMKSENKPKDFLQLMLDKRNDDDDAKTETKTLGLDDIVAQCVMFFLAGYFTTAATLTFIAHNLATHPEVQERLIKEIEEAIKDKSKIERKATEDYKLGDTGIIIPKGMLVAIPTYALNNDPEYFPEPGKFNPDRFLPENKDSIRSYTNLPFGSGPRNCVGMRFALMEVKLCLAKVLRQIRFKPGSKTKPEIELVKGKGLHRPKNAFLRTVIREDK